MKFKCHGCGVILKRDMRRKENKKYMTKRGYFTCCSILKKNVSLKSLSALSIVLLSVLLRVFQFHFPESGEHAPQLRHMIYGVFSSETLQSPSSFLDSPQNGHGKSVSSCSLCLVNLLASFMELDYNL